MARIPLIAVLLAACGADSSQGGRVEHGSASTIANTSPIDAAGVDAVARECFCFWWVHLDENGESCFETKPKCETEFNAFGRDDKFPCSSAQRPTCGSYACRNIGKECFGL